MVFEAPDTRRKRLLTFGGIAVIALFLIAFWKEIIDVLQLSFALFKLLIGNQFELPSESTPRSFMIILYNLLCGFGLIFFLWLLIVSQQALLPVNNLREVQRTAYHFLLFILRSHGPAIFVKDGEAQTTEEDNLRHGPGVIVMDYNSAVVLEERSPHSGLSRPITTVSGGIFSVLGLSDFRESPRAVGPGIVFTRPGERIRGTVDLRRQFRLQRAIPCYTREGIELNANILSIFTIGEDPDVLEVTYVGSHRPDNLRVVSFERKANGLVVSSISDDLDEIDRAEIARFAHHVNRGHEWLVYEPLPTLPYTPVFNRERVFSAVFAQARTSNQEIVPWTELPVRVASDYYREVLSQINYDDLYDVKGNGNLPLPQYKSRVRLRMRNNGILSFRMIAHRSGSDLAKGMLCSEDDLMVSEVQPLTGSKILRDRGIKIVMASFGDPSPVSEAIYKLRLDAWRASWERDLEITRADWDLEAMKIRSRAHAQTQRDLTFALARIFENNEYSDEAIALRILQSLEKAATDPKTGQLLPANTMDMLRTVHTLLLSSESRNNPQLPASQRTPQEN